MRGPYSNGFDLPALAGKDVVVITGGTGLAPVKNVIDQLATGKVKTKSLRVLVGFKSPKDVLFENTQVIVVGPPMMMKFTTLALRKAGYLDKNMTVSFERNMSCGIGKCSHCKIDETYVCLEGPVFGYEKAAHLLD